MRFWLETGLATATGALLVLTLITRDWIEAVFGVDPDQHNGSFEWLLVAVLLAATFALSASARAEWRKARAAGV
ncbi:MAG: ABC transporter permease [Chloroflexota bacterium]